MSDATAPIADTRAYQKHSDVLDYPQARHTTSAAFIYLLLASTFLFYFFAPFINRYVANLDDGQNPGALWQFLMYYTSLHVALTAIFYVDPAMFALMKQNRLRFMIVAPAIFIGVLWMWIVGSPRTMLYFSGVYVVWTYWHFQKQHWGVYSFIRIHEKSRPQTLDRRIGLYGGFLPVAMVAIAGVIRTGDPQYIWPVVRDAAQFVVRFAGPVLIVSMAMAAYAIIREVQASRRAAQPVAVLSLVMLAFLSCNNWPFLVFGTGELPIAMVNTGHGLQYIVFMTVFAYDRNRVYRLRDGAGAGHTLMSRISRRIDARWLGPLISLLYVGGMFAGAAWLFHGRASRVLASALSIGPVLSGVQLTRVAQAVATAITIVHYILDASAWKLTNPEARAVMTRKYDFVLRRRTPSIVPH